MVGLMDRRSHACVQKSVARCAGGGQAVGRRTLTPCDIGFAQSLHIIQDGFSLSLSRKYRTRHPAITERHPAADQQPAGVPTRSSSHAEGRTTAHEAEATAGHSCQCRGSAPPGDGLSPAVPNAQGACRSDSAPRSPMPTAFSDALSILPKTQGEDGFLQTGAFLDVCRQVLPVVGEALGTFCLLRTCQPA